MGSGPPVKITKIGFLSTLLYVPSSLAIILMGKQGSKIALVRSYLRVPWAAGQVKILILLVKIIFFPYIPIFFVMQGRCLF